MRYISTSNVAKIMFMVAWAAHSITYLISRYVYLPAVIKTPGIDRMGSMCMASMALHRVALNVLKNTKQSNSRIGTIIYYLLILLYFSIIKLR